MKACKIVLCLSLLLLYSGNAAAQSIAAGTFQSYRGVGLSFQRGVHASKDFSTYTIMADMGAVFAGDSDIPGVKLSYSRNFHLISFTPSDGELMYIYAGSGVSSGWVQDYMMPEFGFEAALTGTFGLRLVFERRLVLTAGISLETGAFVHRENGQLKYSIYKNGLYQCLFPHVIIAWKIL